MNFVDAILLFIIIIILGLIFYFGILKNNASPCKKCSSRNHCTKQNENHGSFSNPRNQSCCDHSCNNKDDN